MPGEFASGSHRGRMNPADGQLYVSGMTGWGSYTPLDGSFQRVRYTGEPAQVPVAFHAHQNGVLDRVRPPPRPVHRQPARLPLRPGLELPLRPRLRLAGALPVPPLDPRPRPAADPIRHGPRRRPEPVPRAARLAAGGPAPPPPQGRRRAARRPLRHRPPPRRPLHRPARLHADGQARRRPPDPRRHARPDDQARPEPLVEADPGRPVRSGSRPART